MNELNTNFFLQEANCHSFMKLKKLLKINNKGLKAMLFILLFGVQSSFSEIAAQRVTLNKKNIPLTKAFKELEKQSGYYFMYDPALIKGKSTNVSLTDASFNKTLEILLKDQGLDYKIVGTTVTLIAGNKQQDLLQVEGQVLLSEGEKKEAFKIRGVSVTEKGTNRAVQTDQNGQFSIQVRKNAVLLFSFIGYERQERIIQDGSRLEVVLQPAEEFLEEVVISGYGITENKANQVGSAFTVQAKDLENKPVDRIDRLLEGVVPGFEVQSQDASNSSARPRYSSRVRGEASSPYGVSSNEPLWIVDGVPLYTGGVTNLMPGMEVSVSPLSYLDPADIESITVMKDASATTIYGANGANGVVYITTKKGTVKNEVRYSFKAGFSQLSNNRFQVLSGDEYNGILREMGLQDQVNEVNTDWYDLYFRNGFNTVHNLSFSGKNGGLRHYISASIYDDKKTTLANTTKRYTGRINLEQEVGEKFKVHLNSSGSYNANAIFNPGSFYYTNRPNVSAFNEDGTFALRDQNGGRIMNSLAEANQNDNSQSTFNVNGNVGFTYSILKNLTLKSENGIDFNFSAEDEYRSMYNLSGMSSNGYARRAQSNVLRWLSINTATYQKRFLKGDFNAILGMEASETRRKSVNARGSNFAHDKIREVSYAADDSRVGGGSASDGSSLSYFARAAYVWDTKYALTTSFRRDGDSNFGKDVNWANFMSIGAAWTLSNEDFWESRTIDFLKLKMSYGTNGNSRFSGNYSKGIYSFNSEYSYDGNPGAVMTRGMNDRLKWETTFMYNTGLDIRFLNRFSLAVEYYKNITKNLIDNANVSLTSGQRRIYQNSGKIQNTGLEIVLNTENIQKEDFTWSTSFNISRNRNKILELANGADRYYTNAIMREGENSRAIFLVRYAGVDPRDGAPLWLDADGNITRAYDAANRVIVGTPTPDYFGGMTNRVYYKGFSLSVQLLFTKGGYSFSSLRRSSESDGLNIAKENQSKNILDHWKAPGDLALTPRLSTVTTGSSRNSTRFLHDKSNVRLNNVSIGYELPANYLKSLFVKKASIYLQGDNLGFWTPYKDRKDRNTYKNSFDSWPQVQSFSLGLNVGF